MIGSEDVYGEVKAENFFFIMKQHPSLKTHPKLLITHHLSVIIV